jgi:hypothetical protein
VEEGEGEVNAEFYAQRIFARISKPNGEDGCWLWQGAKTSGGYGSIKIEYKVYPTHRVVYEAFNGATNLDVCHRCDTPLCVNPKHLFAGTEKDNIQDMINKKRNNPEKTRGSNSARAILNEANVLEIKRLLAKGVKEKRLGPIFGVSSRTISNIKRGLSWGHL